MKKQISYLGYIIDLDVTFNDNESSKGRLRHIISYNIYHEIKINPCTSAVAGSTRYSSSKDLLIDMVKLEDDAMAYARNNSREPIDRSLVDQLELIGYKKI